MGLGAEENRFLQYCILNRAKMGACAESRVQQDLAAAQRAEILLRTAYQALRERDRPSVADEGRPSAIIDTSAIEVCVEHG